MSPDAADTQVADLRARLGRLERAVTRRSRQVARLAAQVEVLGEEARSPLERTVDGAHDPELALGSPSFSLAAQLHRRAHLTHLFEHEGAPEPVLLIAPKLPAQRWAAVRSRPKP